MVQGETQGYELPQNTATNLVIITDGAKANPMYIVYLVYLNIHSSFKYTHIKKSARRNYRIYTLLKAK